MVKGDRIWCVPLPPVQLLGPEAFCLLDSFNMSEYLDIHNRDLEDGPNFVCVSPSTKPMAKVANKAYKNNYKQDT